MKQDAPSFSPESAATATTKSPKQEGSLFSSPLASNNSPKLGGSDATIPEATKDSTQTAAHALNNATALFAKGAAKKHSGSTVLPRHVWHETGSGGNTVRGSPSGEQAAEKSLGRRGHPSGGTLGRSVFDKEDEPQLEISMSLLDPHPIVVPPPGSRLAFAGANTPVMAHLFRALPSLEDTLLRQAKAPLCLYNYWQYLADIESGAEELEFFLSLADYEALHRRFAHGSEQSAAQMGAEPAARRRNGRVESGVLGPQSTGRRLLSQVHERHVDTFDTETQELDRYLAQISRQTAAASADSACRLHRQCTHAHRPFTLHAASPKLDTPAQRMRRHGLRGLLNRMFSGEVRADRPAAHEEATHEPLLPEPLQPEPHGDAPAVPTDHEMRRSAERLYFHYLLPGGPAELRISGKMRDEVAARVEKDERFDAQLFAPVKRHAYEAMRHESHLRFLRERLFHNITRGTAAPRIALGLALVFVALTVQLALVFLDVKPKGWRWLPMAALWLGLAYAVAGVTRLDPFMAMLGRYEATAWAFGPVLDSTVRHSHLKRAAMQLIVTAGVAALITLVLFLVPGNRL